MTCRHDRTRDRDCSSHPDNVRAREDEYARERTKETMIDATNKNRADAAEARLKELTANTPDPNQFEIEDIAQVGRMLVLKVKYPSCSKCAYEGTKVLVIDNAQVIDAVKWRQIDPHFRQNASDHKTAHPKSAPSPIARFPGSTEGWSDAINWAQIKTRATGTMR